jgi:hypothetical protein
MWILWWSLYVIGGLIGFYVLIVLPLVFLYSAMFPQDCRACNQRTLKCLKFVTKEPGLPKRADFIPRAYYECQECRATFKLEHGDWSPVKKNEVEQMTR